ncbi:reverse transcriptase domain-containing protein [Tanacetum coccineum]
MVTLGDGKHSTNALMNFMVVRSLSPYNGIIGRPGLKKIKAVPSTAHEMLKFPVEGGIVTIRSNTIIPAEYRMYPEQTVTIGGSLSEKGRMELYNLLKDNLDIFSWKLENMIGVPRPIAEHRLNIRKGCQPIRQKRRRQAPDRNKAIQEEVAKLVEAEIMREVHYHDWLSNPFMLKKHDGSWRMCVDFTDLNKLCPKDCYPLPEIDWKVESLCGYPFNCFLDAYKGYHQIQMAEEDEEKMTFQTNQGVFCYTKMPFGLKNAGATYQRLVDKAFEIQIGRNLEVYVDDLVIKSHIAHEILRDIEETFHNLRRINMKLNPKNAHLVRKKERFWATLNGKLASLKRFLSKSAKKSLPFFKTLKRCVKKSDFQWTPEAERAFQNMKKCIAELPMVTAPKPKEELIMYLCATREAVSAVLLTERDSRKVPVYFVSRALQTPEINYNSMEKLVLALVHATRRLRRYFQAHLVVVITDQPIKQILSRPENTGRMLKWKFELEAFDITYRPRTSIRGQILADFIAERPDEEGPSMKVQVEEAIPEPWTLFTDGSSCLEGSGAELILTSPEGKEFTYALRFEFDASNNKAEYEALVVGLRIAEQMGVKNLIAKVDSRLVSRSENKKADALSKIASTSFAHLTKQVLVETLKRKSIEEREILAVVEEEGYCWMTPLIEYLAEDLDFWEKSYLTTESSSKTIHSKTGARSSISSKAVRPVEIEMPSIRCAGVNQSENDKGLLLNLDILEERREKAAVREARNKAKMEKYYNAKVHSTSFRPGDFVYRSNEASHAKEGGKLGPKWEGPYEVVEALGKGAYKLRNGSEDVLPCTWNVQDLKKCYL